MVLSRQGPKILQELLKTAPLCVLKSWTSPPPSSKTPSHQQFVVGLLVLLIAQKRVLFGRLL